LIYVLKGYDGEDLSTFMRDLAYYHGIKVDEDGGVDTLNPKIDIEAASKHFEQLQKDIYRFGQAVDKGQDKLGNSPSGVALRFIYSGLDLKCNNLEDSFKWSFEQLIYFVNKYLEVTKKGTTSDREISIVFNRDIDINESQAITDCQNSKGVISDRTIIANHPWVENVEEEIGQIEKENSTPDDDLLKQHDHGNQDEK
jgi:SPP1 family phage portal protein